MTPFITMQIDKERDYQDKKWGPGSKHTVMEWIQIMHHCLGKARGAARLGSENEAMLEILQATAVGVAAMEEHGAPERTHDTG